MTWLRCGGQLLARLLGATGDPYLRSQVNGVPCDPFPRTFPQLKALCGRSVVGGGMPAHRKAQQSVR